MTIKKEYELGDSAWIYGITRRNNTLVEGKVVHKFQLREDYPVNYVISIPTHIEPLLEVRSWESMSQDEIGPLGMYRDIRDKLTSTTKLLSKMGFTEADEFDDIAEPTVEQIHEAIEKSTQLAIHPPLNLKEKKPRKRYFSRKKKA